MEIFPGGIFEKNLIKGDSNMESLNDTLLISIDIREGGSTLMLVGRKRRGELLEIINSFQDEEARDIYNKLTEKKEIQQ